MNNYESLGLLITKVRDLLDSIRGGAIRKMKDEYQVTKANMSQEHTAALSELSRSSDTKLKEVELALRRLRTSGDTLNLALTKNQVMDYGWDGPAAGFSANRNVKLSPFQLINQIYDFRSAVEISLLNDIEADVKADYPDFCIRANDDYHTKFYIFRVSWDFPDDRLSEFRWLFTPDHFGSMDAGGASMPSIGVSTAAAFVKLESGTPPTGYFVDGCEVGKWKFSTYTKDNHGFGSSYLPRPMAQSASGSLLIALPVISTGVIGHPDDFFVLPSIDFPAHEY